MLKLMEWIASGFLCLITVQDNTMLKPQGTVPFRCSRLITVQDNTMLKLKVDIILVYPMFNYRSG